MKIPKKMRILTAFLVMVMVFSLVACGVGTKIETTATGEKSTAEEQKSTDTSTEAAKPIDPMGKYDPIIEVTSVKALTDIPQKVLAKNPEILENNIWSNAYEKDLGIKVKYLWSTEASQYEQKLNVSISANDLPDIIQCNARQLKLLADTGVATDMTQIFKDYAVPFTMEMMQADNNISLDQATINGKLMALPQVTGNLDGASMLWIRADWLKNLNLEPPKTMADVFKISEAFTKNDPDKNSKNDTYGLGLEKGLFASQIADLEGFLEGYHAYANGWIKDSSGNLVFGGIQPEMKAGLAKLAEMYKDGQIDKEFSVKDPAKVAEFIVSGRIGMIYGMHWLPFWPLKDSKSKDPKADWKAYPIVSIDEKPATPMLSGSAGAFYVVNKSMKNPEAAVKLYNFYYAKDPALSKDFDPKFHSADGQDNFFWAAVSSFYPQQNVFIHRGVKKYFETNDESLLSNYWLKDNIEQNKKYLAGDNEQWTAFMWSGTNGAESINDYYDTNKMFLINSYIKADTKSMTEKGATLKQLRDETFTKIIMGVAPVDEFDKYVEQWKKLGGDDITKEVNEAK